jgi:hypothetical protein
MEGFMRSVLVCLGLLIAATTGWTQTTGPLERENGYWRQIIQGELPAGTEVTARTTGRIRITGDQGASVRYRITKRLKAANAQEAERLLAQTRVETRRQGPTAVLRVIDLDCPRCAFTADIDVNVPRATKRVSVDTAGGSLEVVGVAGDVGAETGGGSISMSAIGGGVKAYTAGGAIYLGEVGGQVQCATAGGSIRVDSAGGNTVLTTSGGGIEARHVAGDLRAETAGGSIRALRVLGNVSAATSGGSIRLGEVGGMIDAETAGGSIHVDSAPKGVNAETGGGGIVLNKVAGKVIATSGAGPIRVYFVSGQPLADSLLETAVGNIAVWLPATIALRVDAAIDFASGANRIQTDFDGVVVQRSDDGFGPGRVVAVGAINGGGPVLRIRNTNGRIQIQKTAQEK